MKYVILNDGETWVTFNDDCVIYDDEANTIHSIKEGDAFITNARESGTGWDKGISEIEMRKEEDKEIEKMYPSLVDIPPDPFELEPYDDEENDDDNVPGM